MEEEARVADYFVTVGLNKLSEPETDYETLEPITDLAVIFRSAGEEPPPGYECIETTPTGLSANLNHGSLRSQTCFLCYRRGRDKPPLTDIGVLHEGRQRLMHGCDIVLKTPTKQFANINNASNSRLFMTFRRASPQFAHSSLAVIDICVIIASKGEKPPHAFCLIDRNLNQGLGGSNVYLCYRKSLARTNSLSYQAEIISKYSAGGHVDYPLPDSVQLFCLPLGAVIECWPDTAQPPLPIFSTFALTDSKGEKIYGAGVTFFEEFPKDRFTNEVEELISQQRQHYKNENVVAQTNKCICLLSRYPFFDAFRRFLMALYRLSVSGPRQIPIERYISQFMHNVPFPTPRKPRVFVQMTHEGFEITEPNNGPLPVSGASYTALLRCLGTENTMTLLSCILTEHKILVHSLRPALLTSVGEALTALIFPFQWKCPYIPLCPLILADVLSAPFPFIYGIDSRYFDQGSPPTDVTCVDLDTNMITQSAETNKQINWKSLPKKPCKVLKDKLDEVFAQLHLVATEDNNVAVEMAPLNVDASAAKRKQNIEVDIQEAFLRFHAQLLQGYEQYLLPITSRPDIGSRDLTTLFDLAGFMKSRPRGTEKFFQLLTKTQLFIHFVETRSLASNNSMFMFFDECIEKCETPARFLHADNNDVSNSFTTVVVTPPDMTGLPKDKTYVYQGFPTLQPDLFISPTNPTIESLKPQVVGTPPRSHIVGRTKHERQQSTMSAKKQVNSPKMWARCLLGHCYTIWYIQLPAFVKFHADKEYVLYQAFEYLKKISGSLAKLPDEVCYRILMQLCGQYNHPALAVKVLFEMKRCKIQPNAVTWGYYHKAILEGEWQPDQISRSSTALWKKVQIIFHAMHAFRANLKPGARHLPDGSRHLPDESRQPSDKAKRVPDVNRLLDLEEGGEDLGVQPLVETASVGAGSDAGYSSSTLISTEDLNQPPAAEKLIDIDDEAPSQVAPTHSRNLSVSSQISVETDAPIAKTTRRLSEASITSTSSSTPGSSHIVVCSDTIDQSTDAGSSRVAIEAVITSCQICATCEKAIYDEEIMGGWSADDSNLQIKCPFCQTKKVPMLSIIIRDYRGLHSKLCSSQSLGSASNPSTNVETEESSKTMQQLEDFFSSPQPQTKPIPITKKLSDMDLLAGSCSAPTSTSGSPSNNPQQYLQHPMQHRKSKSACSGNLNMFMGTPSEREIDSVPYLSPLVLRKELENLLENQGDEVLQSKDIVHQKPIIYWNLVWYFRRLGLLMSHLPYLLLEHFSTERSGLYGEVLISTSWDTNRQDENNTPLYLLWNIPPERRHLITEKDWAPYSILTTIKSHVTKNDLMQPLKILIDERSRQQKANPNVHWSLYRELLFLALTTCGEENIEVDAFDREYKAAYRELLRQHPDRLYPDDKTPTVKATFCRKAFQPPTLQPRKARL